MNEDPLVDIGIGKYLELKPELLDNDDILSQLKTVLSQYSKGEVSYINASEKVLELTGFIQPLDFIKSILSISEMPIPGNFNIPYPNFHHEVKSSIGRKKSQPWTFYEDQRLLAAIHKYGLSDWSSVSAFVGNNRSQAQCSQRWIRGINPNLSKNSWSQEEDDRLLKLIALHGTKSWTHIASHFGNRCDVQCRYRYYQLYRQLDFQERMTNFCTNLEKEGHVIHKNFNPVQRSRKKQTIQYPSIPTTTHFITPTPPSYYIPFPSFQVVPNPFNISNIPNSNISNGIPNPAISNVQQIPLSFIPIISPFHPVSMVQNVPNTPNISNSQNVPNIPNISNSQNVPNTPNISNNPNIPTIKNVQAMQTIPLNQPFLVYPMNNFQDQIMKKNSRQQIK